MRIEEGKFYRTKGGEKVGPLAPDGSQWFTDGNLDWDHVGKRFGRRSPDETDLIAEWSDGPVRTETVTRKVIVPGKYGRIGVSGTYNSDAALEILDRQGGRIDGCNMSAAELRAAAATFIELADALEQQP